MCYESDVAGLEDPSTSCLLVIPMVLVGPDVSKTDSTVLIY